MKKYCDYYITTKRVTIDKTNGCIPVYRYAWYIRNKEGEELQSSYTTTDDKEFQTFETKEVAMQEAAEAIQDHYN